MGGIQNQNNECWSNTWVTHKNEWTYWMRVATSIEISVTGIHVYSTEMVNRDYVLEMLVFSFLGNSCTIMYFNLLVNWAFWHCVIYRHERYIRVHKPAVLHMGTLLRESIDCQERFQERMMFEWPLILSIKKPFAFPPSHFQLLLTDSV